MAGSSPLSGQRDRTLPPRLEEQRERIVKLAKGYGLDFFDTIFLMCSYDEINMLAAYGGFPTRYPHWRYGMEYVELAKGYEYGLQKIYEMVINTEPSYAYLMDNNPDVDQKLVMAHVLGHVDFFKNNKWFQHTNRKMVDQMANHSVRVQRFIDRHGESEVEEWIDTCLSLDNLIDPHATHIRRTRDRSDEELEQLDLEDGVYKLPARKYMDRYVDTHPEFLEAQREKRREERKQARKFPEEPQRDILGFLVHNAPLPAWKAAILNIIRAEAYYFAPQAQTKIMNEGWATYWHTTMMTNDLLTSAEVIDYADHHSGTVATAPGRLNPYKLGVELYRDIERRWNRGMFGKKWLDCDDAQARRDWDSGAMLGRQKIFEVRRDHNDVTFVDEYLTEDFVRREGIFTWDYDKRSGEFKMSSRDFRDVKRQLMFMLTNHGNPRIFAVDANHANRGELLVVHEHDGVDLQLQWSERTLGNLVKVWGRPCHLKTVVDDKAVVLSHDGDTLSQEVVSA